MLLASGRFLARALASACVLSALVGVPAAVGAQEGEVEGDAAHFDADAASRARAEYETGVGHYREGRYREAIRSFQVAASITPSADLSFNIARAYEELARREGTVADWDESITYYRRYLSDAVDPPDRADVEAHIAQLVELAEGARRAALSRPTLGTLTVRADHDGARVRVGDDDAGVTPIAEPLELAPGRYALAADLPGYVPYRGEVTVEAGVRTSAVIELSPGTNYTSTKTLVHHRREPRHRPRHRPARRPRRRQRRHRRQDDQPHPKLPGTIYTAAEDIEKAGGKALPLQVDVRDEAQVAEAVEDRRHLRRHRHRREQRQRHLAHRHHSTRP
jgi:tetratricopeptide (TPR) repeat protein